MLSVGGTAISILIGNQMGKRVHIPSFNPTARRAILFWVFLVLYAIAFIAVAWPTDGKQITMLIILFVMFGQLSMGLLLSFSATWWALPISGLALIGYFLLPNLFYLWMGLLVGGGMIALGVYIRSRW